MDLDQDKLNAFMGRAVVDIGATFHAGLVIIGDKLGLYKALADAAPAHPGASWRRRRAPTSATCASGSTRRPPAATSPTTPTGTYSLTEEQAFALADEDSPAFLPGGFSSRTSAVKAEPKITEAFRTGEGVRLARARPGAVRGHRAVLPPRLRGNLVTVVDPRARRRRGEARRGARVADVGCGHGASTILMAQAYPKSTFVGFDYHGPSIETARKAAQRGGRRATASRFEGAGASDFPGHGLRPRRVLRLPARHGRSGRRGDARAALARPRTARG